MNEPNHLVSHPGELEKERNALARDRTRLAAERTFLSWLRTGLTSIGIGIAITRFLTFEATWHQKIAEYVGQALILWGFGIFVIAFFSYRRTYRQFKSEALLRSYFVLAISTAVLMVVSLILFWIVVQ